MTVSLSPELPQHKPGLIPELDWGRTCSGPLALVERATADNPIEPDICSQRLPGPGQSGAPGASGTVTVAQLRHLLISGGLAPEETDEVWGRLVRRARGTGAEGRWTCVALAVPGLSRAARELCGAGSARSFFSREDCEAELVVGFLERLATLDMDDARQRRVCGRLIDAGVRRARRVLRQTGGQAPGRAERLEAAGNGLASAGHPEVVLWRAVGAGVLGPEESELIARTRLEGHLLTDEAARQGMGVRTASVRRRQAEQDLVAAILEGTI